MEVEYIFHIGPWRILIIREGKMNEMQRKVLIVVAIIVFGLLLYPPWHKYMIGTSYDWIWSTYVDSTVDAGLLITQLVGVLIIGGIAYLLFKDTTN